MVVVAAAAVVVVVAAAAVGVVADNLHFFVDLLTKALMQ